MPECIHNCPRCGRAWKVRDLFQLPDLGVHRRLRREGGQVVAYHCRMRRCTCDQLLEQADLAVLEAEQAEQAA